MGGSTLATVVVGGLGVIVALLGGLLGFTVHGAIRWGRLTATVEGIQRGIATYAAAHEKVHAEITGGMRADRAATDRRLGDVERLVWAMTPAARPRAEGS